MMINRLKTSVWLGALSLVPVVVLAVALALGLGSCTREPFGAGSMTRGDALQVRVTFAHSAASKATTRAVEAGAAAENRLDYVAILIFNADGTKLESVLSVDVTSANSSLATTQPQWRTDSTLLVSPLIDPTSPKKIYAIANWSVKSFDKSKYTEADLKKDITAITAVAELNNTLTTPMLMSGSQYVQSLSSAHYSVKVGIARQAAKIRANITIATDMQNNMPTIEWQIDRMKITVANVPDMSYVIAGEASPAGKKMLTSAIIDIDDVKPVPNDQTVPASKPLKWVESVYVNENMVMGKAQPSKDSATYIVVQMPYKNRITGTVVEDNYYKLLVNNTTDTKSPHKVLRNTIYNFNVSIVGIGLPINNLVPEVNVTDTLTVNDWEQGAMGDVGGSQNYFNIDRTFLGFDNFTTSLTSTIVTDVADWKLINAAGVTLFSFADSKTAPFTLDGITYTLSGTASTATITVSNLTLLTRFPIQQMSFIAKNLKVPFTVTLDNGFIPNSVLLAGGWPQKRLPAEGGLQLAKRGIRVFPSGVATAIDPSKQCKTSNSRTFSTSSGLGMGQISTEAMAGTEHPAAQYCRDMGPEWYLPSKDELLLILKYQTEGSCGRSYRFDETNYWSSSDDNLYNSNWCVYFALDGQAHAAAKTYDHSVRCVKGTIPLDLGSYIPTAVLAAAGWPADRLPKLGLQLATRGRRLLPGIILPGKDDYDHSTQWKIDESHSIGVESITAFDDAKLGECKRSTDAMTKTAALRALHPAAAYCREMGPEWYLPSLAELTVIWKNMGSLGPNYQFGFGDYYWSSTQYMITNDSSKTCFKASFNGSRGYSGKTDLRTIRCVREI